MKFAVRLLVIVLLIACPISIHADQKREALSPDGKFLIVTDFGHQMIWDIAAGKMSTTAQPIR
jgi:hypothetical protein